MKEILYAFVYLPGLYLFHKKGNFKVNLNNIKRFIRDSVSFIKLH